LTTNHNTPRLLRNRVSKNQVALSPHSIPLRPDSQDLVQRGEATLSKNVSEQRGSANPERIDENQDEGRAFRLDVL
jgi:hypothetical protein